MSDEARKFLIRGQRNCILSNLCVIYPGSIAGEQLYMVMIGSFPEYNRLNCVKDLTYLEQKGYVLRKHPLTGKAAPGCEWKEAMWCLTARGNEVANDLVDDPALEV